VLYYLLLTGFLRSSSWELIIQEVLYALLLWFSTWHTARYLRERFIIKNPDKVVNWSIGVYLILTLVSLIFFSSTEETMPMWTNIVMTGIAIAIFYTQSRKYLRK
jgi:protein-S-isoprenylcysteine O-methyltransferase Ste14